MSTSKSSGRVTRLQIAEMFGMSWSTADNWTRRYPNFPAKGDDGKFDRAEIVAWHAAQWPGGDRYFRIRRGQRQSDRYRTALVAIREVAHMWRRSHGGSPEVEALLKAIVSAVDGALDEKPNP